MTVTQFRMTASQTLVDLSKVAGLQCSALDAGVSLDAFAAGFGGVHVPTARKIVGTFQQQVSHLIEGFSCGIPSCLGVGFIRETTPL
ncbi:hypothetical protein BS47DRAFT_275935 [Hydnum rufescens UP504]|uniref:Uncharacterized protein n=1 Tax=Hydnum rufescens UP504 TaxID=1448309 RepID=A0A9P6DRL8_9AGAM|nr:hypothetical protein BS47DRAFT_275935 [Hydnum rufescens UP504]